MKRLIILLGLVISLNVYGGNGLGGGGTISGGIVGSATATNITDAVGSNVTLNGTNNYIFGELGISNNFGNNIGIMMISNTFIGFGGFDYLSPPASIFYNVLHADEPEFQFGTGGSFAFSAGQDYQHKAVIQLGSALATHDQAYLEADAGADLGTLIPDWLTNDYPSKILAFRTLSNSFSIQSMYVTSGFRGEPAGANNNIIVGYNPLAWQLRHQPLSRSAGVPQWEMTPSGVNIDQSLQIGISYVPSVLDTVVSNFIVAAVTNLTPKQISALNNFVLSAKANGYWGKLLSFNPMVGGSASTALFNLVNTNNFKMVVHGTVFYTNGIALDGASGWVDTGINPKTSFVTLSNQMFFCWVNNTTFPAAFSSFIGSYDGANNWAGIVADASTPFIDINYPNTLVTSGAIALPNSPNPSGFMGVTMTNSSKINYWFNSANVNVSTVTGFSTGDSVNLALGDLTFNNTKAANSYSFCGSATNFYAIDMTNLVNDLIVLRSNLYAPQLLVSGTTSLNGDVSISGNLNGAAMFSIIRTNFLLATLYTNSLSVPIQVSANAALTTASVAGMVQLSLEVPNQVTNYASLLTAIGVATGVSTNALTPVIVPAGGTYFFRNTSSGAGDSAAVVGGQIFVY